MLPVPGGYQKKKLHFNHQLGHPEGKKWRFDITGAAGQVVKKFSRWAFWLISTTWISPQQMISLLDLLGVTNTIALAYVQCWSMGRMKKSTSRCFADDIQTWNADKLQIKIESQGAKRDANQHDPNIVAPNFRPG